MKQEFYDAMYEIEQTHWWFQAKQNIVKALLEKYLPQSPDGRRRLLDAGCGCGLMLEALRQYGDVEGMDYSETAIQYCRRSFSGPLRQWELNVPLEFERPFDGIVALDVLEHVADDHTAIRTLANGLTEGGVAVITVPANPWMWSRHDESCMHQRRYTRKSLEELCRASGLQVCMLSYYNFWLFLPVACVRLLEKLFPAKEGGKEALENQLPLPVLNRLFYRIFNTERLLLRKNATLPFGVSLIAVLVKT